MTASTNHRLTAFAAVFTVTDLEASVAYYKERLGFNAKLLWGEPPAYAIMECQGVELHLSPDVGQQRVAGQGRVYIYVAGIDAAHADLARRGARLESPPTDRPYGMRDFNAFDLDGNNLAFGEEAAPDAVAA